MGRSLCGVSTGQKESSGDELPSLRLVPTEVYEDLCFFTSPNEFIPVTLE